jgi:hypothetical protein
MYKISILIFLFLSFFKVLGQEKSISKKKVSKTIQNFITSNYPNAEHVKYFEEKENEQTFIESEFRSGHKIYSLKFLEDKLVETEIEVEFTDLPSASQATIKANLDSLFSTYKILKCEEVNPNTDPLYEVNIKTKDRNYYELYYSKSGQLIKKNQVIIKPIPTQF